MRPPIEGYKDARNWNALSIREDFEGIIERGHESLTTPEKDLLACNGGGTASSSDESRRFRPCDHNLASTVVKVIRGIDRYVQLPDASAPALPAAIETRDGGSMPD